MAQVSTGLGREASAEDRLRVERLLARYPALSANELHDLVRWFAREASALDVALVASNERIRDGYERFKAEHIDTFTLADVIRAAVFLALFGGAALGLIWLAG